MLLKIKIKMREVCLKLTGEVTQQAEQLINSTDPQNKIWWKYFCYERYYLRKNKMSRRSFVWNLKSFQRSW